MIAVSVGMVLAVTCAGLRSVLRQQCCVVLADTKRIFYGRATEARFPAQPAPFVKVERLRLFCW
jgi:hypothetical protein